MATSAKRPITFAAEDGKQCWQHNEHGKKGFEQPDQPNKRRSIDISTAGNNARASMDSIQSSFMHASPASTTSAGSGLEGYQSSLAQTQEYARPSLEKPAVPKTSSPPAIGIPFAMPSGFALPFIPPPLMYFWMQQMAVQHAMSYMHCPPATNTNTSSCPSLVPPATGMQPWAVDPSGCGLPPAPPSPPPMSELPDLPPMPLPTPSAAAASLSTVRASSVDGDGPAKADSGSSNCSNSEYGLVDIDFASFIDSFLLSGPDQSLPIPGGGPQVDLSEPLPAPPLGLHLTAAVAEEDLDMLYNDNVISSVASQHCTPALLC